MASGTNKPVEIKLDQYAGISSAQGPTVKARLTDVENLTKAILWVGMITVVAVVVSSSMMVIDQMNFNNQTYVDQSRESDARYEEITTRLDSLKQELASQKAATASQPSSQPSQ